MAIIQPTTIKVNTRLLIKTYSNITESDTCEAYESAGFADRSVQVSGTFGGETITIEGSNDGTTYFTLTDHLGVDLSFTVAGFALIAEAPRYVRAAPAGNGTSTSVDVIIANNAVSM